MSKKDELSGLSAILLSFFIFLLFNFIIILSKMNDKREKETNYSKLNKKKIITK